VAHNDSLAKKALQCSVRVATERAYLGNFLEGDFDTILM